MKFYSSLIAAAGLALASTASADVTVRITGSSAFRASTVNGIRNLMTFSGVDQGFAYEGTSFTGSNFHIFRGTFSGITGVTTVKCAWNGSVAGVQAVDTAGFTLPYLALNTTTSPSGTGTVYALSPSGTASVNADNRDDVAEADVAMSDNTKASTKYNATSSTLDKVGIVPFAFVVSRSAPSALDNITPQLAQTLYNTGYTSLSLFTNNPADSMADALSSGGAGRVVYAMGRDPLSGTRLISLSEVGLGYSGTVAQYINTATTGTSPNIAVSGINLTAQLDNTPTGNFPGPEDFVAGNNGDTSGGNLCDRLRYISDNVTDNNNFPSGPVRACFIAYLGEADAARAVNGTGSSINGTANVGCRYLKYNGVNAFGGVVISTNTASTTNGSPVVTGLATAGLVPGQLVRSTTGQIPGDSVILTVDSGTQVTLTKNATVTAAGTVNFQTSNLLPNAIWNGTYTVWGYEYIMKDASLTSGDKFTFYNNLKTEIHDNSYFLSGLSETSMQVARGSDGGTVGSTQSLP